METIPALIDDEDSAREAARGLRVRVAELEEERDHLSVLLAEADPVHRLEDLPHGRGTVHLLRGSWERGQVRMLQHWVILALERPTAAGVTTRVYSREQVERVDFDDA